MEGLLGAQGDIGLLWGQLTSALACRHCGNSCLQSPGNLVTLFLFIVWQIQRWWQLGRWPLQPQCSGNMMQCKGLPLLHSVAFLDCLWKQKSEEEEPEDEKDDEAGLQLLKPYAPPKEVSTGEQTTIASPQPSCGSHGFLKTSGIPEQILTHPVTPSRSFAAFQILTNLPVRHSTSGSCLQQRKSQLFWGPPSLHSEFLEATPKMSVGPSIFFNRCAFLLKPNLLLPQYYHPTQLSKVYTMEDLEGLDPEPHLPSPSPSPAVLPIALHLKPFPTGDKWVQSGTEAHALLLKQKDDPRVRKGQALDPQPEFQRTGPSKILSSSETLWKVLWDSSLQHLNEDSYPVPLLYHSSPLGVQTRSEPPKKTMGQYEDLKVSEPEMSVPCPIPTSLPELQEVHPVGDPSGSEAICETMRQRKNHQISNPPIIKPCQPTAPTTAPQGTSPLGVPLGYETQWRTIKHKGSLQASEPPMPASCQSADSLFEPQKVIPEERLSSPETFWGTMGQKWNPQTSEFLGQAFCLPQAPRPELHGGSNLQDPSGYNTQVECRENSQTSWALAFTDLDLNPCSVPLPGIYGTSLAHVSSESEDPWKDIQRRDNLGISVDPVIPPSSPSTCLLQSTRIGTQEVLPESKALWNSIGQRGSLWAFQSPASTHSPPLAPLLKSQRIKPVGGLPGSEAAQKDNEHSRNFRATELPSLVLSPLPARVLGSFEVSPMEVLSASAAVCQDLQRGKNSRASELLACRLPQDQPEASPLRMLSDSELTREVTEQKENCCTPVPPVRGPSTLPNSVPKSHIIEPTGDQWDYKPAREVTEQRANCKATDRPASGSSSLSATPSELHMDSKFTWRSMQSTEAHQGSSPAAVHPLQTMLWPPTLAETKKVEPTQTELLKGELHPGAKVETAPSQKETVSDMSTHPGVQAWHWSRELELKLKNLQQNSASRSPGISQPLCSSPVPNSTTLGSWKVSSCSPQWTHSPNLCSYTSSCHFRKAQGTVPQPAQISHCHHPHFSFQLQSPESSRSKQRFQKEESMKRKMVAQVPSQESYVLLEASDKSPSLGEPSNPMVSALVKREKKVPALPSAKKREGPQECKSGDHGRGDTGLGSFTVIGKSHSPQSQRLAEAPEGRLFQKLRYGGQSTLHMCLPQQFLPKHKGLQNQHGAEMAAGDMQNPQHCKHCKKSLSSPTPQAPLASSLQRMFAHFLGTFGPQPINSNPQKKRCRTST